MGLYRPDLGTEVPRGVDRPSSTEAAVHAALRGRRFRPADVAVEGALLLTLLVALAVLVILIADVVSNGWRVLAERPRSFLTSSNSTFSFNAGVGQGIVGSVTLMVFVIVFAFPLGIGAAVYLEEYAHDTRFTRFLSTNIRNLAGVPSIVYGLLGLAIFADLLSGVTGGFSVISGGLTLAILVLPIVIITSSEALRAVPESIREAGYGVGATRWQVIRSHVLPSAAPGIFTGTVLTLARALGETAPLLLVGALTGFFATGAAGFVDKLQGPYTSLPTVIFSWSTLPNPEFRHLTAAAILVLLAVLLTINALAIVLRNRYERRW